MIALLREEDPLFSASTSMRAGVWPYPESPTRGASSSRKSTCATRTVLKALQAPRAPVARLRRARLNSRRQSRYHYILTLARALFEINGSDVSV